jgi:hypothetical protein
MDFASEAFLFIFWVPASWNAREITVIISALQANRVCIESILLAHRLWLSRLSLLALRILHSLLLFLLDGTELGHQGFTGTGTGEREQLKSRPFGCVHRFLDSGFLMGKARKHRASSDWTPFERYV